MAARVNRLKKAARQGRQEPRAPFPTRQVELSVSCCIPFDRQAVVGSMPRCEERDGRPYSNVPEGAGISLRHGHFQETVASEQGQGGARRAIAVGAHDARQTGASQLHLIGACRIKIAEVYVGDAVSKAVGVDYLAVDQSFAFHSDLGQGQGYQLFQWGGRCREVPLRPQSGPRRARKHLGRERSRSPRAP